jgi:predicted DNA repair protein MutK
VALLDDVAVLARAAAASVDDIGAAAGRASMKAAGVVVDDTAVTPQYVQGLSAQREVPIIRRIALGSLRNKLLIILPAILLLSEFLDFLLTPLLMCGGAYLCYEGAEKVWGRLRGHGPSAQEATEPPDENTIVSGAVRTDFILSAEIMVISLNEVARESFLSRATILIVVALAITVLVYGVVALIVKMDDVGLNLAQRPGARVASFGRGLVKGMPKLLTALTVVGTAAMLWVGGHILLVGTHDLGWHTDLRRRPPRRGGRPRRGRRRRRPGGLAGQHAGERRDRAGGRGAARAGPEPHAAPGRRARGRPLGALSRGTPGRGAGGAGRD